MRCVFASLAVTLLFQCAGREQDTGAGRQHGTQEDDTKHQDAAASPEILKLVEEYQSPVCEIREKAQRALLEKRLQVIHELTRLIEKGVDVQAEARYREIMAFLQRVAAVLELKARELRPGDRLQWSVRMINNADRTIVLSKSLEMSEYKWRYPYISFEILGPDGKPVPLTPTPPRPTGGNGRLAEKDLVELKPGESFDPFGPGAFGASHIDTWSPKQAGRYKVRFIYDSSSTDPLEWCLDFIGAGLDEKTIKKFGMMYHDVITSEWVEFEVRG